jgi:hypothetical protein
MGAAVRQNDETLERRKSHVIRNKKRACIASTPESSPTRKRTPTVRLGSGR